MSIYDFKVQAGDGSQVDLGDHRGQVLVIVNTASKCGFTPQFAGLEALYQQFKDRGVTVIGFPCNQFGNQDPGTNEEIAEFCQVNYGVTFPMMAKVDVKGDDADPLFTWLTAGDDIQWNFTKFLIGRDGEVAERFDTRVEPATMSDAIEKALSA
ncbi:MAG: glutathione peroxidase [Candidatus Nanopelagicales bacterium]|nr:glutathione peroxidase [Actinomycetota bacterium]HNE89303.1 glutathione peroxidase [Actinomycetota bacterium]HNO15939.1 glutathione peroxidase [Actinomycetota bacterium]HRY10467.1 glutathione peroxidase [Candidatus Nanopelagicales bacterium]HUM87081.1 glutathione peroxidase [Actinomycetota bacterium]